MNRLSRWGIVSVLALWVQSAQAGHWSIGTNLGLAVLHPKGGGDNLTVIGVPGGAGPFFPGFQPGLRLGILGEGGKGGLNLDIGLSSLFVSGQSFNSFQGTVNLLRNFSPSASATPFVTVGAGLLALRAEEETSTNAIFGGGLGIQNRLSHEHGALRGGVRLDYITENEEGFVGGLVFGIKLGFDLWMK